MLNEAAELTAGDRNREYGDPYRNHKQIADIFNAWTGGCLTASDIVKIQIATKMSRIAQSPGHADSHVDLMAYTGIHAECERMGRHATQPG